MIIAISIASLMIVVAVMADAKVGEVDVVEGQVTVAGKPAVPGLPVRLNDLVKTEEDGKVRIKCTDGSFISVAVNSNLKIDEYVYNPKDKVRKTGISLLCGKLKAFVNDVMDYRHKKFCVTTVTAVVGVRGSTMLVDCQLGQTDTLAANFDGRIYAANVQILNEEVDIPVNYYTIIAEGKVPTPPMPITPEMRKKLNSGLLAEDAERDKIKFAGILPVTDESPPGAAPPDKEGSMGVAVGGAAAAAALIAASAGSSGGGGGAGCCNDPAGAGWAAVETCTGTTCPDPPAFFNDAYNLVGSVNCCSLNWTHTNVGATGTWTGTLTQTDYLTYNGVCNWTLGSGNVTTKNGIGQFNLGAGTYNGTETWTHVYGAGSPNFGVTCTGTSTITATRY